MDGGERREQDITSIRMSCFKVGLPLLASSKGSGCIGVDLCSLTTN